MGEQEYPADSSQRPGKAVTMMKASDHDWKFTTRRR